MADILGALGGAIAEQFAIGEPQNRTLDSMFLGQREEYGQLGAFASKFDASAQRKYLEEGYLRTDPFNVEPKQTEVLFQEPSATVFIKKRMFSSIAENYRPDYMDKDEALYFKALKILFQNKCNVIAALEKLTKIHQITSKMGSVSEQLIPILSTLADTISDGGIAGLENDKFNIMGAGGFGSKGSASQFVNVMNQVRKLYAFNSANYNTTWITDSSNLFQSTFGKGTGVIEITNFTNIRTNLSVNGRGGNFSLTIVDPYESMVISEWDIERAIADATNMWTSHSMFNLGKENIDKSINDKQQQLNEFRSRRGAGAISFQIVPEAFLGRRVTAIFDRLGIELKFDFNSGFGGLGSSAEVAPEYLKGGAIAGNEGLDTEKGVDLSGIRRLVTEKSLFSDLISSIYSKIQLNANSKNAFQIANKETNYVRRKLHEEFLGHLIIQPMDVIHIYMSSKSRYDNKLLAGMQSMFAGLGILQSANNLTIDLKNAAGALFNPSGNVNTQIEKTAYVGSDFPNYLWSMLRNQFVSENEGTHTFAGVVTSAIDRWIDGKFTIDVSGEDNMFYFKQGKVNFKPGIDVWNGSIFDPLTPFKSKFDVVTNNFSSNTPEPLDENIAILGTSKDKTGIVKAKAGPLAGKKITADSLFGNTITDPSTKQQIKEVYAPDGLVYKWKQGIGTFTQSGSSLAQNNQDTTGQPSITKDPLAGQDIMNVISLLITGQPYNFANYFKANREFNAILKDPQSKEDAIQSYSDSLKRDLIKNNALWGNFIPFKNLDINPEAFANSKWYQASVTRKNDDLSAKLTELSNLQNKLDLFSSIGPDITTVAGDSKSEIEKLKNRVDAITSSIKDDLNSIKQDEENLAATLKQAGDDALYDFADTIDLSKINTLPANTQVLYELKRQMNKLTRRMSYNVRSNTDKNLFIVDDSYDKDYDIIAFNKALEGPNGFQIWNNEFMDVRDKISAVAGIINLEVFCDTQGHIRARSPKYNRIPSSVFYKMMYLKRAYGVQIFPQFLSDMFTSEIDSLRKKIEILEDLIRLDCAVLGQFDDISASDFIRSAGGASSSGAPFGFISDPNGLISDISKLIASEKSSNEDIQDLLSSLQNKGFKSVFTNSQRYQTILNSVKPQLEQSGVNAQVMAFNQSTYVQDLINRIKDKSGVNVAKKDYIIYPFNNIADVTLSNNFAKVDVSKATLELQEKLRERTSAIKLMYNTIKNAIEFKTLDNDDSISNKLIGPAIFGNKKVPEILQHMIEDESYDDYGPGSGSRYIIKQSQIMSLSIQANEPDFNMIEVSGTFIPENPAELPDMNGAFEHGNPIVTAKAVDYSSWRNYGLKTASPINVPFLRDPESQCAPYAAMLLSRARASIITGSVTIAGNEYMQPGDVIFLEGRQMLFYVSAVSHSFTWNGRFTTDLTLTYGHSPGVYIPTPTDMIGKILFNNQDANKYLIRRQANSGNELNIGVLLKDPSGSNSLAGANEANTNTYASANTDVIKNILYSSALKMNANESAHNNVKTSIELRVYKDKNSSEDGDLKSFANDIKDILLGNANTGDPQIKSFSRDRFKDKIDIKVVDLDSDSDRRSPSQKAWDAARNQFKSPGFSSSSSNTGVMDNAKLRKALISYVVDCWIVLTQTG